MTYLGAQYSWISDSTVMMNVREEMHGHPCASEISLNTLDKPTQGRQPGILSKRELYIFFFLSLECIIAIYTTILTHTDDNHTPYRFRMDICCTLVCSHTLTVQFLVLTNLLLKATAGSHEWKLWVLSTAQYSADNRSSKLIQSVNATNQYVLCCCAFKTNHLMDEGREIAV